MFTVIFKRPIAAIAEESMEKPMEKTVEETSEKILELIERNNSITISELAKRIGLTTRAIEKQIDKLRKDNRIARIGSRKSGHWLITPKPV